MPTPAKWKPKTFKGWAVFTPRGALWHASVSTLKCLAWQQSGAYTKQEMREKMARGYTIQRVTVTPEESP